MKKSLQSKIINNRAVKKPNDNIDNVDNGDNVDVILLDKDDNRYDKKTDLEHALLRPDTYIGGIKRTEQEHWVYNSEKGSMELETLFITPGAFKVFDEILVNARDHSIRDSSVTRIKVDVDMDEKSITVYNNGNGVPIKIHSKFNQYIPFMLFGEFKTGENYNDDQDRIVGGRNGFGSTLTNAYSTLFQVETIDPERKLKWRQTFRNNLSVVEEPKITKFSGQPYTKIKFILDFDRLGMKDGIDSDFLKLIERRVIDIAGTSDKRLNIYFNNELVKVNNKTLKTFEQYMDLYIGKKSETKRIYKTLDNENTDHPEFQWQIGATFSDDGFKHTSFVNGTSTSSGGKHVDYIRKQISDKLRNKFKDKLRKDMNISSRKMTNYINNHLWIFVNAVVVNPTFSSQTKETLTLEPKDFKFKCTVPDKFVEDLDKRCGILAKAARLAEYKESETFIKTTSGKKQRNVKGIDKLEDADWAGGARSTECTLIITEGDSAKTFAMSGLSVIGRKKYGVFPIRGVPLNTRNASDKQIFNNKEINNLVKIIGLQRGKVYTDLSQLRYGCIMILTDQDLDGFHIKALLMNFIENEWPELLKFNGFIKTFLTPIIIATHAGQKKMFFTIQEYDLWKRTMGDASSGWKAGYFKGLGTSTPAEARSYFRDMEKYEREYFCENYKKTRQLFEDAFDNDRKKNKAAVRKTWLMNYDPDIGLDYTEKSFSYEDFVDKEFIHFMKYDTERNICNIVDGLKTSQRKILWTCKKIGLYNKPLKVEQLAGKVSEMSGYHHGEQSLKDAITGMAQNFVGSNIINLLYPSGQFGSRIAKGKDASSARYIFTKLNRIVTKLFPTQDDNVLNYLADDNGKSIEPVIYYPIIPMVLVNGCEGMGTGFSTSISCYNPKEIIENLLCLIDGKPTKEMTPFFNNFKGTVTKLENHKYECKGVWLRTDDNKIQITELPVGANKCPSFEKYKTFLEDVTIANNSCKCKKKCKKQCKKQFIKGFKAGYDDVKCDFQVIFPDKQKLDDLINSGKLETKLGLTNIISTSNMHGFDEKIHIRKFSTPKDIIKYFYQIRYAIYEKRKTFLIQELESKILKITEKLRFLKLFRLGKIKLADRRDPEITADLETLNFAKINENYSYLLSTPINQLSLTQMEKLTKQLTDRNAELIETRNASCKTIWKNELAELLGEIDFLYKENERLIYDNADNNKKKKKRKKAPKKKNSKKPKII